MKRIAIITIFLVAVTGIVISCGTETTAPTTFTLTTSVSPGESESVSPAQGSFDEGGAISLQATHSQCRLAV